MQLRIATQEDLDSFVLSTKDLLEQIASGNEYEFDNPEDYDVIVDDSNNVLALGGISVYGTIWLLTSDFVSKLPLTDKKEFIRLIRRQIENYKKHSKHRPFFYNTVWEKNEDHMKFIEACGGIFDYNNKYNSTMGEPFIPFVIPNEYYGGKRCATGR